MRRFLPLAVLALAVIGVQLLASAVNKVFYLTQLTMAAYYCLVVLGLCLLMGYAGQISLGQAGFFAIGGYTSAFLTTVNLRPQAGTPLVQALARMGLAVERKDLYGNSLLSFAPWLALAAAVVLTILVALIIGWPVIRLTGHYLAMATLGFGLIVFRLVLGTRFLGEADGISGVPPLPLFFFNVTGALKHRIENYYLAWALVFLGMLLAINLVNSRVGRALRSIHGGEEAANAMGVNTDRYKLATFVMSAVFAGAAGVFLTHYKGGIGPSEAASMKSVRYVAIVALGGMDNLWGALAMGTLLNFLSLRGYFGSFDDAFFAATLLAVMLFFPEGLLKPKLGFIRRSRAGEGP